MSWGGLLHSALLGCDCLGRCAVVQLNLPSSFSVDYRVLHRLSGAAFVFLACARVCS